MHDKKILSKSRLYVHLSETFETAEDVGKRHGEPFVFIINTARMSNDGFKFYKSVNGVWLTKEVPIEYVDSQNETLNNIS